MNGDYREQLSRKIEGAYSDLEVRIMQDIVRRIRQTGKITSTADWQINRLRILGNSSEDIEKMLKEALDASYPEMFELYDRVIDWEYVRSKDIYEQINAEFIPYEKNKQLQQITEALIRQSGEDLDNITRLLGFYLDYGNGRRILTPLAEVYQKYLDAACMDIVSGAFDYNSVLRRVVTQLTNSGLRQIDYASGHATRINVAARRAIMAGVAKLTGHISNMNAERLGAEYYEVAWHSGARPAHQAWQGRVWTRDQLVTVCGLGTVTGLLGANCYHEYYPFFPGISERNWSDAWLEEQNRKENTPKEWMGRKYTVYEAKQQQRQMETAMRAQREKVALLKEGGADPDETMLARCKYQAQLDEYGRFSRKMNLQQERERIYYDMRGRVAPESMKAMRMFPPQMIQNAGRDIKQYERYKKIIGKDAGSLAQFGQNKYNDNERWKFMKLDYQRRNELIEHPGLKLPHAEGAVLPDGKFTRYLFGGDHAEGLAKGKAFSSRLGYSEKNWKELRDEIRQRASKYPAVYKGNNGYGDRYEQKMIIYGKSAMPANVVVGWLHRPDGSTSMSSAYIKEVK